MTAERDVLRVALDNYLTAFSNFLSAKRDRESVTAPDTFTPDEYEFRVFKDGALYTAGLGSRESVITDAALRAAEAKDTPRRFVEIKYFARADVTARLVGEPGENTT